MKIKDSESSLDRPLDSVFTDPRGWRHGSVITALGIVKVYTEAAEDREPYTSLAFVLGGRLYQRTIYGRTFTKRGLVTVAHRFAREVANG